MKRTIAPVLFAAALAGCATGNTGGSGPGHEGRSAEDNLTRKLAEFRASQVKSVTYDLFFRLSSGAKTYDGSTRITLELTKTDAPLSLDFVGKEIRSVDVGRVRVTDFIQRTGSIEIPARYLTPRTEITIAY
ncbi:MAG TPA: hypothetical protein VKT80_20195, partial [Chloroflexota bacterium]|nr:hypothetical protein [Chloroflexota bacterium]